MSQCLQEDGTFFGRRVLRQGPGGGLLPEGGLQEGDVRVNARERVVRLVIAFGSLSLEALAMGQETEHGSQPRAIVAGSALVDGSQAGGEVRHGSG